MQSSTALPEFPVLERRPHAWGQTLVLCEIGGVEVRVLVLEPGTETSLHRHAVRHELQIPLGAVRAIVGPGARPIELPDGHTAFVIPAGVEHQFAAPPTDEPGLVVSLTFGRTAGKDRI